MGTSSDSKGEVAGLGVHIGLPPKPAACSLEQDIFCCGQGCFTSRTYRLKKTDEARAVFAKGAEIERAALANSEYGIHRYGWLDWTMAHALMQEAKTLLGDDSEAKPETM